MNRTAIYFLSSALLASNSALVLSQEELAYVAVEPCRIADTRQSSGGAIKADTVRNFLVSGSAEDLAVQGGEVECANPKEGVAPVAIAAYVLAVPANSSSDKGVLSAYPSDEDAPPAGSGSTVNFGLDQTIGNTTIVTICSSDCPSTGELAVLARKTDEHAVIDVQGYFYPQTVAGYRAVVDVFTASNTNGFIATIDCPAGTFVLGGGASMVDNGWFLNGSYPKDDASGWRVNYRTTGDNFSAAGNIWAICAPVN